MQTIFLIIKYAFDSWCDDNLHKFKINLEYNVTYRDCPIIEDFPTR